MGSNGEAWQILTGNDGRLLPDDGRFLPKNGRKLPANKVLRRSLRRS
jgi:hypothetical protein